MSENRGPLWDKMVGSIGPQPRNPRDFPEGSEQKRQAQEAWRQWHGKKESFMQKAAETGQAKNLADMGIKNIKEQGAALAGSGRFNEQWFQEQRQNRIKSDLKFGHLERIGGQLIEQRPDKYIVYDAQGKKIGEHSGTHPGSKAPEANGSYYTGKGGDQDLNSLIESVLGQSLSGQGGPFDQKMVQLQQGKAQREQEGQLKSAQDRLDFQGALTGRARSGADSRARADLGRASAQQQAAQATNIEMTAVLENHKDKMAALDRAEQHINSIRQAALQKEGLGIQRQQVENQLRLGLANIEAQREMLNSQLSANMQQFQSDLAFRQDQLGFQREQFDFTKDQNTVPIQLPDGTIKHIPLSQLGIFT